MQLSFETNNKPTCLHVKVYAEKPCRVHIKGLDLNNNYGTYFDRTAGSKSPLVGEKKFVIPMPLSPRELTLEITNTQGHNNIQLLSTKAVELKKQVPTCAPWENESPVLKAWELEFMEFAKWLAVHLPQLPLTTGNREPYTSNDGNFRCVLSNVIRNKETGQVKSTPASITHDIGIMELSQKKMSAYTIPMRILVMLHEIQHFMLNERQELPCDKGALRLFLTMGFPVTEAMYAFVKVFPDTEFFRHRVNTIMNWLKSYDKAYPRK